MNFRKNSKWLQWNTWGPGGHGFMEKTWSRKSRVRLPLNEIFGPNCECCPIEQSYVLACRTWALLKSQYQHQLVLGMASCNTTFFILFYIFMYVWRYATGCQKVRNNVRLAASRKQIILEWCKLYPRGGQSQANYRGFYSCWMRLAATRVQFVCDWRPVASNFCMR